MRSVQGGQGSIAELISRMGALLVPLEEADDQRRHFLAAYRRTTRAVQEELQDYDLPLALLASITDEEFQDPVIVDRRARDHARIDAILASRVDAEDQELEKVERPGDRTRLDRLLTPFNQSATKRFMKEARRKVWRNAVVLSGARRDGPKALATRLDQLEEVASRRVAELRVPGQVLIRLAVRGFGARLPD
jgi:hypothetical protein